MFQGYLSFEGKSKDYGDIYIYICIKILRKKGCIAINHGHDQNNGEPNAIETENEKGTGSQRASHGLLDAGAP